MFQGFEITSEEEIEKLKHYCKNVFIDSKKSTCTLQRSHTPVNYGQQTSTKKVKVDFEQELNTANELYLSTKRALAELKENLLNEQPTSLAALQNEIQDCIKSIHRNPSALMWLSQIKNKLDYSTEHALRVSILSITFAKQLKLSDEDIEELAISALLYDIGNIYIPKELLDKMGRLTFKEKLEVRQHALKGKDTLETIPDIPPSAIEAAYYHHERIDGKGYPQGLTGDKIPYLTKIISIIDCYDALTSDRSFKISRSPDKALQIIYNSRGQHFDRELCEEFVKFIGVYPPGHIAELNTGHVGIIIASDKQRKLKPIIMLVMDAKKQACQPRIIDLSTSDTLSNGTTLQIRQVHHNGTFCIELKDYKEIGLQLWKSMLESSPRTQPLAPKKRYNH
jgi:HD-GYP domain-containing protein (c-di-GMP phosphodiesterase class II)